MGLMSFGAPQYLVLALARHFDSDDFVETGTFRGDTAEWASRHFKRVTTVERSPEHHLAASARLSAFANVRCVLGSSEECLAGILPFVAPHALFWLDAHWCGGKSSTAGKDAACPVLQEISAINRAGFDQIILIDDARLFTNAHSSLYDDGSFPGIGEVMSLLNIDNKRYTIITDDVIVSLPAAEEQALWRILKGDPDRIWGDTTKKALRIARELKGSLSRSWS